MDKNSEYFLVWLKANDPDLYYEVIDKLRNNALSGLSSIWDSISSLTTKLPDLANSVQKYNLQTQQIKDMKANTDLLKKQQQQALLQQQQAGQNAEYSFLNKQGAQDTIKKFALPIAAIGALALFFMMKKKK